MNLDSSIDFDLKRFFRWWRRELAFFVPEKIRRALSNETGYVYLQVLGETFRFSQEIDGQKKIIAELAFNDQGLEQFQNLLDRKIELKNARLILRLNSEQAIKKTLYLPAAVKENLQQVVEFEMDKYTPFKSDQVYFAIKPQGKEENDQIKVLLIFTPKDILDTINLQLNRAGIYPDVIDYEGVVNDFSEDFQVYNLLPEWERPVKNRLEQTITWLLSFVLLMLIMAVLVFPAWNEGQAVDSLKRQIKELQKETHFVQSQQLEIDKIVDETEQLNKFKQSGPVLLEIINTLSELIKQDTWLTHFKYKRGRLQLQGQSPTAEVLIGVLEASPLFSNVRFVSPLTQDKRTGLERFQISVDVNSPGDTDEK